MNFASLFSIEGLLVLVIGFVGGFIFNHYFQKQNEKITAQIFDPIDAKWAETVKKKDEVVAAVQQENNALKQQLFEKTIGDLVANKVKEEIARLTVKE